MHNLVRRPRIYSALCISALLIAGCATPLQRDFFPTDELMTDCLHAATGNMTKSDLLFLVGNPTAREKLEDGGEIWNYRFSQQGPTQSTGTISPFIFGTALTQSTEFTPSYSGFVNLYFDPHGVLCNWKFQGNFNDIRPNPFLTIDILDGPTPPQAGLRIYGFLTDRYRYYITEVESGSTAELAGLMPGDYIESFNGSKDKLYPHTILSYLAGKPDTSVRVTYWRKAGNITKTVDIKRELMDPKRIKRSVQCFK